MPGEISKEGFKELVRVFYKCVKASPCIAPPGFDLRHLATTLSRQDPILTFPLGDGHERRDVHQVQDNPPPRGWRGPVEGFQDSFKMPGQKSVAQQTAGPKVLKQRFTTCSGLAIHGSGCCRYLYLQDHCRRFFSRC